MGMHKATPESGKYRRDWKMRRKKKMFASLETILQVQTLPTQTCSLIMLINLGKGNQKLLYFRGSARITKEVQWIIVILLNFLKFTVLQENGNPNLNQELGVFSIESKSIFVLCDFSWIFAICIQAESTNREYAIAQAKVLQPKIWNLNFCWQYEVNRLFCKDRQTKQTKNGKQRWSL